MTAPVRGDEVRLDPPGPSRPARGRFGEFGGRFVPETLIPALEELEAEFRTAWAVRRVPAPSSRSCSASYAGRPTPVTECHRLSERLGVRVLLKREDLTHTGSHKINNVLGQALLTRRMGKQRVIAETGAGQHGVATATAAALFGLDCIVFMGAVDVERQALNVFRMQLLGAEVVPVDVGQRDAQGRDQRRAARLGRDRRDARTTASARSSGRTRTRGSCASSSGSSATRRASSAGRSSAARIPDYVVACVGGGSNAIGTFAGFLDTDAAARRRRGRRARARVGQARRVGEPRRARACCTARARCSSRTRTARSSRRTRSAPGSTTRASVPSTRRSRRPAGPSTTRPPTTRRSPASSCSAATEGIVPALEPAHAIGWLAREAGARVPAGLDRARHALGPGRQGRDAGGRAARPAEPLE